MQANFYAQAIFNLHRLLIYDLQTGEDNEIFSLAQQLDQFVLHDHETTTVKHILSSPQVKQILPRLRKNLSLVEYQQEKNTAAKILRHKTTLQEFANYAQYQALLAAELKCIQLLLPQDSKVCFVGSGPLPLSAMALRQTPGIASVKAVDWNEEARQLGQTFARHFQADIDFSTENAAAIDYSPYDLIFIASLVEGKKTILPRIAATARNAVVVIRTAEGLRQLVYEPVKPGDIPDRFTLLHKTGLIPDSVNSTLFYRVS